MFLTLLRKLLTLIWNDKFMYISKEERAKLKAKLLKEAVEETAKDDIVVEVDGEEIVDTSEVTTEEKIESTEAPKTPADMAITDMLSTLIKDELEAIEGYNSVISTLRSMMEDPEAEIDNDNITSSIKVLEDIAGEEYIHIGQLQEVQKLFNSQTDLIAEGEEEAKEQLEK